MQGFDWSREVRNLPLHLYISISVSTSVTLSALIVVHVPLINIIILAQYLYLLVKDARSVSLYPYNQSQICKMLSKLNELTLQKDLQNIVTNNVFMDKK